MVEARRKRLEGCECGRHLGNGGRKCREACKCGRHDRKRTGPRPNFTGHQRSNESKAKTSKSLKYAYQNGLRVASCAVPNRAELQLLEKLKPFGFTFVGNGELRIGGKSPDFWDGGSNLVELYGRHWHQNDDPQERIDLFKVEGYNCIIVWDDEIEEFEYNA